MDISQLRSFVTVAESGSYISASDVLSIPQPTLSRQVRALEVELRASLFHRHGRGVRLTEQGKKFIEYARSVLHTMDTAVLSVRDQSANYSGRLVVGLTPSIGRILIPTLAPRLKERFPHASFSLTEGLSGVLHERVLLGQVDFAIVLNPASSASLEIEPLATEQVCLVGLEPAGSQHGVIKLAELTMLPLILPHGNQWMRPAVEAAAARLGLRLNVQFEMDATFSILELVAQGFGCSIMPGSMRGLPSAAPLSWQEIVEPRLEATVCMVTSTRRPHSRLLAAATGLARQTYLEVVSRSRAGGS